MLKFYVYIAAIILSTSSLKAQDKIYQLSSLAIVADNGEWRCIVDRQNSFGGGGYPFVMGNAIQLPISFECHEYPVYHTNGLDSFHAAENILFAYAQKKIPSSA